MPTNSFLRAASLAVLVCAFTACADDTHTLTQPLATSESTPLDISHGGTLAGSAVVTLREAGVARRVDTTAFATDLQPGDRTPVALNVEGQQVPLVLAVDDQVALRQGSWQVTPPHSPSNNAVVQFEASNGAPVSRMSATVNGELVAQTIDTWERATGGWVLAQRTVTVFKGGTAVRSAEIAFHVDQARLVVSASGVASAPRTSLVARSVAVGHLTTFHDAGNCDAQADALFSALDYYTAAAAWADADGSIGPMVVLVVATYLLDNAMSAFVACMGAGH